MSFPISRPSPCDFHKNETKKRYTQRTILGSAGTPATMDCEFIQEIETWGSGGHMMDVLILKDGRVLVLTESGIALYESRAAFDSGAKSAVIDIASAAPQSQLVEILRPPRRSRA